ncbi:hypothetical protein [Glutamicibacter arilaitensis]|uniref:Uncharacterized protein n=1 Tax=Glutamicibacter arilaitensis TaxID=256701 RepID=A0A2N7S4W7_9MICC|nr:hypothetical protein [Glutamicibacter arilaitensis]PMQ21189.1 hypothetical protein CIK84_06370 [Glutamicibacter arilaitensis]
MERPSELRGDEPHHSRALLRASLNGHLLPHGKGADTKLTLSVPFRDDYRKICGAKEVTNLNSDQTKAYVVRRNQTKFWRETLRLVRNTMRLRSTYEENICLRQGGYNQLTSDG